MTLQFSESSLVLRDITDLDKELLFRIYSSTRMQEMQQLPGWSDEMKEGFLQQQFNAQHFHYHNNYKGANFWMIERNGEAIGRLYLLEDFEKNTFLVIDITLLPQWRNKGIGEIIFRDIMKTAGDKGYTVTLHAELFNPAIHLYKRLGFEIISETNGIYYLMEWRSMPETTKV